MDRTFSLNGATITARETTIRDAMQRDRILAVLRDVYPDQITAIYIYARAVSGSTMDGEIQGWTLPPMNASDDELIANYEAWLDLPSSVYDSWLLVVSAPVDSEEHAEKKGKTG